MLHVLFKSEGALPGSISYVQHLAGVDFKIDINV